jgi:outer membrane protein TolC
MARNRLFLTLFAFAALCMEIRAADVPTSPMAEAGEKILPINLATALRLANAQPIDVQIAGRQVELAAASYDRARLLWVPNLIMGADYFRHEGGQQNFAGDVLDSSRGALSAGLGPNVVFSFADALYQPLAAKQDLLARRAYLQTANNDTVLNVAEVYFSLQQARGELAGALYTAEKAEEVNRIAAKLAEGIAPPLEATRAKVELARRQQVVSTARERWRVASAELARLLRIPSGSLIDPLEPANLPIAVVQETAELDELIAIGLTNRPELAGHQAIVKATLERLKLEKVRPLVPSLAVRSVSTNPSGSIGYGTFGGGANSSLSNFGSRFDIDAQLLWEFQALGFGNKARVGERKAEHQIATLELFRTQDRIAAEVTQAHAQLKAAAERMKQAEPAFKESVDLVEKSLLGMNQTRRVGDVLVLIVRPQEVVAAVQSLGTANSDYYSAVADYNRAQFRLYRALGHPGQCLAERVPASETCEQPIPVRPVVGMRKLQAFACRRGLQFRDRPTIADVALGEAPFSQAEALAVETKPAEAEPTNTLQSFAWLPMLQFHGRPKIADVALGESREELAKEVKPVEAEPKQTLQSFAWLPELQFHGRPTVADVAIGVVVAEERVTEPMRTRKPFASLLVRKRPAIADVVLGETRRLPADDWAKVVKPANSPPTITRAGYAELQGFSERP